MTLKRPPWRDTHGSYTFSAVKFKDFSRTFKDHIFKFQFITINRGSK